MLTVTTIFFKQICITKNMLEYLQNDVNQIFKSVHQI